MISQSLNFCIFLLPVFLVRSEDHYPGTKTRPILSSLEAAQFTEEHYLNGWSPEPIHKNKVDYIVGDGQEYLSIQEAVNVALSQGDTERKYIKILKGVYRETVYIPISNTPLSVYGDPLNPTNVRIEFSQSAQTTGTEYSTTVNPNGTRYKVDDPAYSMFQKCASKTTLGTRCSAIFWIMSNNAEISDLTIENLSKDGQAVAVEINGDLTYFEHVHLLGFQDTLYLNGQGRAFIHNSRICGDVDFVFGSASTVFLNTTFCARSDRPRTSALIFAPSTPAGKKYGFLIKNCKIVANDGISELHLARAWDGKEYIPGTSANGQLVIRESLIPDAINSSAPYAPATSGRFFSGSVNLDRNLDDVNYNRFWEYQNRIEELM